MEKLVLFWSMIGLALSQSCYNDILRACDPLSDSTEISECSSVFGGANNSGFMDQLTAYADVHITRNFQYMLMASHFGNHEKEREGFRTLYRKLSDTAWQDAIDLIKYITMRGGTMNFHYDEESSETENISEMTELLSLSKALDIQKRLATKSHQIYQSVNSHDPEMGSFLENKFMHKHAHTIRNLAGHTNDLMGLLKKDNGTIGLELFIFDHFLQKSS